jgi:hypothetical protein
MRAQATPTRRGGSAQLVVALLFLVSAALADPIVLEAPGEKWRLKFEGPSVTVADPSVTGYDRVYTGDRGRFNVSLHVWEPDCKGGDSQENIYKCFGARLQKNPYIIGETVRAAQAPGGVQIMYLMEVPLDGRKYRNFNLNYVFARDGKWGDLHVSVLSPSSEDLEMIMKVIDSVEFVDAAK